MVHGAAGAVADAAADDEPSANRSAADTGSSGAGSEEMGSARDTVVHEEVANKDFRRLSSAVSKQSNMCADERVDM
jgi:hypothetical protein